MSPFEITNATVRKLVGAAQNMTSKLRAPKQKPYEEGYSLLNSSAAETCLKKKTKIIAARGGDRTSDLAITNGVCYQLRHVNRRWLRTTYVRLSFLGSRGKHCVRVYGTHIFAPERAQIQLVTFESAQFVTHFWVTRFSLWDLKTLRFQPSAYLLAIIISAGTKYNLSMLVIIIGIVNCTLV